MFSPHECAVEEIRHLFCSYTGWLTKNVAQRLLVTDREMTT